MFPSRCSGIEHFLLKLVPGLIDMDLVINVRDYPQSNKYFGSPLPIFSFSKVNKTLFKLCNFILSTRNILNIIKYICRLQNIMILHIQHGRFGKVDLQFLYIPVALGGGMNIVHP